MHGFSLFDRQSSNGTMVYLKEPLPLHVRRPTFLRMGRTTLELQVHQTTSDRIRRVVNRARCSLEAVLRREAPEGDEERGKADEDGELCELKNVKCGEEEEKKEKEGGG